MIDLTMDGTEQDGECHARASLLEGLTCWIIYYRPAINNIEAALQCNLTPFYYKEEFHLALGGCGMDLSPRLDAYQMLTANTIPQESKLFRQRAYFERVAGKETTKKALEACRRPRPRIIISYNESMKQGDHA